jgi:membrane protease YdiL (CAAX protease family)
MSPASAYNQSFRVHWQDVLRTNKLLIVAELVIAALIMVCGFLGVIPYSSTPALLLLGWFSLWLRSVGWRGVGLARPKHFGQTLLLGIVIGIAYQVLSLILVDPFIARFTGRLPEVSQFAPLVGSVNYLLLSLLVSWTLAAFGEELVYRGYLMNRIAGLVNPTQVGWAVSLLVSSILFGAVHSYQGASGVIATGLCGFLFGIVYLASGRNLWLSIIAHGTLDSVGFVLVFLGKYPGL